MEYSGAIHAGTSLTRDPAPDTTVLASATGECLHAGVLTRRVHADRLEDMYERMKCDHYLFSIDHSDYIVDATKTGGTCRFVNHSCGCASSASGGLL